MKNLILLLALAFAPKAFTTPDLVAPIYVNLIGSADQYFDFVKITSFIGNIGDTPTSAKTYNATILSIGIDSVHFKDHLIPQGLVLNAGNFVQYDDTAMVIKGLFSVNTQCDPFFALGQGGGQTLNDIRSQAFNFHPQIFIDTVIVFDTLHIHDTTKVVQKDTIKITLHDTTIVTHRDTVKYCPPPTLAKGSSSIYRPAVASVVYNAIGAPVWTGSLPAGEYPRERLKPGLYLLVQGGQAHRFRMAYR